jgi:hypothetical protein
VVVIHWRRVHRFPDKGYNDMKGLLIKDKTHWCDSWSARIATSLEILDSSYDILIFHHRHNVEDILALVSEAPSHLYRILDVEEAPENSSDFVSDTGKFYRILKSP